MTTSAAVKPNRPRHRLPAVTLPVLVCVVVDTGGTVRVSDCADTPAQVWNVMSNGQIRGAGATCLTLGTDGVTVQALACEAERFSTDKYEPISSQRWVPQMSDPTGWSSGSQFSDADLGSPATYAGSFRLGDVNGDGYADACIRLAGGVYCALNTASGSFAPYSLYSAAFSDGAGWLAAAYGTTVQLGDVNGDGYADVCGRSSSGIVCALNNKAGAFAPATLWIADFTDALGWRPDPYGSTIQFGDINGDGKADVCGRAAAGLWCAIANAAGTAFTDAHQWSLRNDFSDGDGWNASAAFYGSIRLADVNGDGRADICGRSRNGLLCGISNNLEFDVALPVVPQGYADASGWGPAIYGATIQFGGLDQDGRRDVCGRGSTGLVCAKAP